MSILICTIDEPVVSSILSPGMSSITYPNLVAISIIYLCIFILKEVVYLVCLSSIPIPRVNISIPIAFLGSHSYSMSCFMQNSSYCLIGSILGNTHIASITTVSCTTTCTSSWYIVSAKMEAHNSCPFVEIVNCLLYSCTTSVICCSIRTCFIPRPSTITSRMGNNLNFITISHLICIIHNVRAHVIYCSRSQSLCHKDVTIKAPSLCRTIICNNRIMLCTPADTSFKDIAASKGCSKHSFCSTTNEIWICVCYCRSHTCSFCCIRNIECQFCIIQFHNFCRKLCRRSLIILA